MAVKSIPSEVVDEFLQYENARVKQQWDREEAQYMAYRHRVKTPTEGELERDLLLGYHDEMHKLRVKELEKKRRLIPELNARTEAHRLKEKQLQHGANHRKNYGTDEEAFDHGLTQNSHEEALTRGARKG